MTKSVKGARRIAGKSEAVKLLIEGVISTTLRAQACGSLKFPALPGELIVEQLWIGSRQAFFSLDSAEYLYQV